jgi:hypothetical protein
MVTAITDAGAAQMALSRSEGGGDMARHFAPADQLLLQRHKLHRGAYVRVARKLGITPSSVSRVAGGGRQNEKVMRALLRDLYLIDRLTLRVPAKRRSAG